MSMTPEESAHWQHLRQLEREGTIARLVAAAGMVLSQHASEWFSLRIGGKGWCNCNLCSEIGAALEAYRRTEQP